MAAINAMPLLAGKAVASPKMNNLIATAVAYVGNEQRVHILGVSADYSAAVAAIKEVTFNTSSAPARTGIIGTVTTLSAGSTDTRVASTIFQYAITETMYSKAAVAAGTTLASGTVPADKWGLWLKSVDSAGTITSTAAAANTTGYANEAAAIAALPDTPSGEVSMGYLTVLTASGQAFIPDTDALQGGSSGNPSDDTNYYSTASVAPSTAMVPAVQWDFTNGPLIMPFPGVVHGEGGYAVSAVLPASGTGGTTGRIVLYYFVE
jgi:hypothetical protein